MGESAHTIYLATDGGAAVASALVALLGEEGYAGGGATPIGWWKAGAPGWTVLETSPSELLLDRPTGSEEPRIAALARRLGCDVFVLAIHDGAEVLLVEANARGRWAATGSGARSQIDPDTRDRRDPRRGPDGAVPRFVILDASAEMKDAIARSRTGALRAIAKVCAAPGAPLPWAPERTGGATAIRLVRGGGKRVRHARFGEGTLVDEIGGDPPKCDVEFDDGRRMVLLARFLERLDA